jgi:hypothetical protein
MRRIITFFLSILLIFFYSSVAFSQIPYYVPDESYYYYINVYTNDVYVGKLSVSNNNNNLQIGNTDEDYLLWKFTQAAVLKSKYYITNKKTTDTLAFNTVHNPLLDDTIASINNASNQLNIWADLFDIGYYYQPYSYEMCSYHEGVPYYLTLNDNSIYLSKTNTNYTKIKIRIERQKKLPEVSKYYRLKIDTVYDNTEPVNFLAVDTTRVDYRVSDSLIIGNIENDLGLWKFETDTVISDSTFYRIYNKETNDLLSFAVPVADDTVALTNKTGLGLNRFLIPFFIEDKYNNKLMLRDTAAKQDYYLGLHDSTVLLLRDTSQYRILYFQLAYEDESIYRFDSTGVYSIKYLTGADSGRFAAKDVFNNSIFVDSVYAHIPDGQYVVNVLNHNSLINRTEKNHVNTPDFEFVSDTVTGEHIPDTYKYGSDTVYVRPIDYGGFDASDSTIGYKFFIPDSVITNCYYAFSYSNDDTLTGGVLFADIAEQKIKLERIDTTMFMLKNPIVEYGIPSIGNIASLKRVRYAVSPYIDTAKYMDSNEPMSLTGSIENAGSFYFKNTDSIPDNYSFYMISGSHNKKYAINSLREFKYMKLDTAFNSYFKILEFEIPGPPVEIDTFAYLKSLPNGRGLYELYTTNGENRMLTKNYFNYMVFSKEGESILKSGSFEPNDFYLWLDTARGTGYNPDKPSFFIVKDAMDTASTLGIRGYYMHVFDSAQVTNNSDYVVTFDSAYNRVNFVLAKRTGANKLELPENSFSVGDATPNVKGINEYRFYLQIVDTITNSDEYYIVTEQGFLGKAGNRAYLSYRQEVESGKSYYYFGPRDTLINESNIKVKLKYVPNPTVSNSVVPPAIKEDIIDNSISIIGGTGQVAIKNAKGLNVSIFNIVGQKVAEKMLASDYETLSVPRGIAIVKLGSVKTQKVVIR